MQKDVQISNRLLALISAILAVAALKASYPVTMPLAVSVLVIAALWPVTTFLQRVLPEPVSYVGTVTFLLLVIVAFFVTVYLSVAQFVQVFALNQVRFELYYDQVATRLDRWGIPDIGARQGYARLVGGGRALLMAMYNVVGYLGFIGILVSFGLPEVRRIQKKLTERLSGADSQELLNSVELMAQKVRSYLAMTTMTSLITGTSVGAWALITGLEMPLVWGVLNFLLNYIPVIGNIVGILPPTLFALLQFQDWPRPTAVFIGMSVIQISISNFLYPLLQGSTLSLSPAGIIIALSFWSWVWGIAGAFIAIPLTAIIILLLEHFKSTSFIADLLSRRE